MFIINHNADVHFDSLWYVAENERARNEMKKKTGTREELFTLAKNAGLEFKEEIPIPDPVVQNPEFLLTAEGRSSASVFALYTEEEEAQFEARMKERVEKGEFKEWVESVCRENIEKYGITAHYVFQKKKKTD